MRIPLSWLNELLSEPLEPETIQETLTRVGLEIEALEYRAPGFETVLVGQIVQIEPHPNADRLRICQTDLGTGECVQIVTGASNVKLHDKIPVATVGTILPGDKAINAAKLRGIESFGMYCSLGELGLPLDTDGVHILPEETLVGLPIAQAMKLGELVLDVAITANRPDCLSVVGIARELATALPQISLKLPAGKPVAASGKGAISLGAIEESACPLYLGLNVEGVTVGPSPEWLVKRLEAAGMRAINNVVDATNYVMLLTGQPLHAFDAAKIRGDEIAVRSAAEGETITTLDGVERLLTAADLVIADAERPLVVAGVMGGLDSGVDASTQNLFLEAAFFKPEKVRMTSRRLGLSTESSYRFERGIDPDGTLNALALLRDLIVELAGGHDVGSLLEARQACFPTHPKLKFRLDRIDRLMGVSIPNQEVERILKALGFHLERISDGVYETNAYDVVVPASRMHDVRRETDLVEEVARHYGYDRIPALLPPVVAKPEQPAIALMELRGRALACKLGLSEVVTSSLTSPKAEAEAGVRPLNYVRLQNPIGELAVLRSSPLPSLLETLRRNRYQGQSRLGIFEIGRTYALENEQVSETLWLSGAAMGSVWDGMWLVEHTPSALRADFFFAKGLVESLFEGLEVSGTLSFKPSDACASLHPGRTAEILLDGVAVGYVGEVHPAVAQAYDLPVGQSACAWQLNLRALAEKGEKVHRFSPFSRFPATLRDLAVLVPESVEASQALSLIREAGAPLLEHVAVFDRYAGEQVPSGQVSLGFSLVYRAADRTLSVSDVEPTQERILERLKEELGAILRG